MGRIERFEEIDAWKKARELTRAVFRITGKPPLRNHFGLRDQVERAAASVMANIAEGFERGGNREFRQFLAVAKGSAGEVRALLYVAYDAGMLDESAFRALLGKAEEVSRLIAGFMRYLSRSELKGSKFQEEEAPYAPETASDPKDFEP